MGIWFVYLDTYPAATRVLSRGRERTLGTRLVSVKSYNSRECRRQFRWDSSVYRFFCFHERCRLPRRILKWVLTKKTVKFIISLKWKRKSKIRLVTLNEAANFKRWWPNWCICWRPSSQWRMDSQIPEGGGCWQRTRTNSEWQTRRQYRSQWMVRL